MSPASLSTLPTADDAMARRHAALRDRTRQVISDAEWALHLPYIDAINRLKKEKRAVILAHNYQTPEIFHGVADIVGDSLALAQQAVNVDADIILMAGVHFMAETAKIMNPAKSVLIPDTAAGCSLAEGISAADIRLLRQRYPGVPVVTYVNTTAEVKAESDVCCTSANAVHVVESLGVDRVLFLPDQYLGQYVASKTKVEVILWQGSCEVHERFTGAELRDYRKAQGDVHILAHPECPQDVLAEADFVGSTAAMIHHLDAKRPKRVVMVTECSMSDNVAVNFPDIEFTRPCNLCPHMKRITLPKILDALRLGQHEVHVEAETARRARQAVQRMLDIGRREAA